MFCHSLLSDWNHGNAHFLRGVSSELLARGHDVAVYEPRSSWSLMNLVAEHGLAPLREFRKAYPDLKSIRYNPSTLDLDVALDGADLVIVHEWNDHALVRRIGEYRERAGGFRLLFHDTHHRSVTAPELMAAYDLSRYDGVLAFGEVVRSIYLDRGWAERAWTWHEAADTRIFSPRLGTEPAGDLLWIGNWGDEERTAELKEFLLGPAEALGVKTLIRGVRYPAQALRMIAEAGIEYKGWLPNYAAPQLFAQYRATVHIPRRPYVRALPGIPTIRPFEALACGIPLISAPWDDVEGLFTPGEDFLVAHNKDEMVSRLRLVLNDADRARALAEHGYRTILSRHTCAHRVDELFAVYRELRGVPEDESAGKPARAGQGVPARPTARSPLA